MNIRTARGFGHRIVGEELSWVGDCPWTDTLSFGTESGKFIVFPERASPQADQVLEEPINGVAFSGEFAAFSSRGSVLLARRNQSGSNELIGYPIWYTGGAHGVVASSFGGFIAPAGPSGVLLLSPTNDKNGFDVRIAQNNQSPFYAYKLVIAGRNDQQDEIVAFSARERGILAFAYAGKKTDMSAFGHTFEDLDIVSVCALNHPSLPRGVAALSRDCKIILIRDVTSHSDISAFYYPELSGTGYDLIASQGHLFVLTNESFVSLDGLIDDFADSGTPHDCQKASFMQTQATAIYPARDSGEIYLVEDADIMEFHISELVTGETNHTNAISQPVENVSTQAVFKVIEIKSFKPNWSTKMASMELAAA
jgi:hypothetical protein